MTDEHNALTDLKEMIADKSGRGYERSYALEKIETIRRNLKAQWQDISTIPPNGNFLAAWPEIELDEDGDLTDKKTGKYFIGAINMAGGQPNGEADSLNAIGEWYGDDTCWAPEPSHWMPLPAPPEDK